MISAPPLDSIFQGEFEPGTDKVTDDDIEAWLRSVVGSDNHEVGTAAMLPKELGGVVNTQLQVYGTQNVRVVGTPIFFLFSLLFEFNFFARRFDHPNSYQFSSREFGSEYAL